MGHRQHSSLKREGTYSNWLQVWWYGFFKTVILHRSPFAMPGHWLSGIRREEMPDELLIQSRSRQLDWTTTSCTPIAIFSVNISDAFEGGGLYMLSLPLFWRIRLAIWLIQWWEDSDCMLIWSVSILLGCCKSIETDFNKQFLYGVNTTDSNSCHQDYRCSIL